MYKSVMRWITGLFIQIDPIAILKSYVDDLKDNLRKMNRQVGQLRGQMHKLKEMILNNQKEIKANLNQASKAKESNNKIQDQVMIKDQERKAMLAGHSAMKSAMSIIKGDNDKKAMFDAALEAVADDVSNKVGEMEQFMEMSESFMKSVDLQNGIFEEEGLKMLEKWEAQSDSLLLGTVKEELILQANDDEDILDLSQPVKQAEPLERDNNQYDTFFD